MKKCALTVGKYKATSEEIHDANNYLEDHCDLEQLKIQGHQNRHNLKRTTRIYTFRVLKCSEKFKVLDVP